MAQGETALVLACKNLPRTKSVVHSLLKMKSNTNLVTNESCSALQWAAVHCDVEVTLTTFLQLPWVEPKFRLSNGWYGLERG